MHLVQCTSQYASCSKAQVGCLQSLLREVESAPARAGALEVGMPYGGDVGTRLGETATAGRELAHRLNQSLSSKIQKDKNTKIQDTKYKDLTR